MRLSLIPVAMLVALPSTLTPSAVVTVVRDKTSTPVHTVLMVRVEGKGMVLASYEGRVRFDASVFAVDSATAGSDGSRFVNAGDASKGVIRFAGFTPTGFKSNDAVRIVGHSTRPIDAAKVTATLEVAGDLEGKPVGKAGLLPATRVESQK